MASDREREILAKSHPIFLLYRFSTVVLLFFMILTYGTLIITNPSFHMQNFYVPALNKFTNSTPTNNIIFFDLMIHNSMTIVGVRYEAVHLTFSCKNTALGMYTVPGFYQGMNKKAHRRKVVAVVASGLQAAEAEFRADLETHVRLKNWLWYFRDKKITAAGRIRVDDSGKVVGRECVELESSEAPTSTLIFLFWLAGLFILFAACVAIGAIGAYPLYRFFSSL